MYLSAFFTNRGTPAEGLNPKVTIWKMNGDVVISSATMTEIAGGFYSYNFTGYDHTQDYLFRSEDQTLPAGERFVVATNEVDSMNNQGVVKQILGLVQGNFVMSNQTYDANNNLLTADIITYPTAADAQADTNREFEYEVSASYDGNGNVIDYKCVQK